MGQDVSRDDGPQGSEEQEVYLAEGAYGKVYRKGKTVIKRSKYDYNDKDFCSELRFYSWIASLPAAKQRHFSQLLSHKIYRDPGFTHMRKGIDCFPPEFKVAMDKRNAIPWTSEITSEYKGKPFNPQMLYARDQRGKYRFLLKLLGIVKIMKDGGVMHEDMHWGNFVEDPETDELGLIDYGVTFLEGERSRDKELKNEMMHQVVSCMCNFAAFFDIVDELKPRELGTDELLDYVRQNVPELAQYVDRFMRKHYAGWKATNLAEYKDCAFQMSISLLKLKYEPIFLQLHRIAFVPPPFYSEPDIKVIYDNWWDIDAMIRIFEDKT